VRVAALGKKGAVSDLLKTLGAMTPEERKENGPRINGLRDTVQGAIAARREALAETALAARLEAERTDVTLPVQEGPETRGRIHPISQVLDELTAIFADMGFSVAEGPDIETDDYNFTALNFPPGHPAREMHDTFFLRPDHKGERKVLRTHTSPVQIRTMKAQEPPIRVICPGRTYRHDSDQTHTPMFHQVEGLVIDKEAHIGHMKWVLEEFCKAFFEVESVKMRFRPSFFPSPNPRPRSTSNAPGRAARSASARGTTGSRSWAAAWSIPTCCATAASIPTSIRALPGAWASTASPC
jgi:phenylalanyl-tRNA synthetase alpha chain